MQAIIQRSQFQPRILKLKIQAEKCEETSNINPTLNVNIQPQNIPTLTPSQVKLELKVQAPPTIQCISEEHKPVVQKLPSLTTLDFQTYTQDSEKYNHQFGDEIKEESKIMNFYLMFNGEIKNIEDLKVGDQLMGADSQPCSILSIEKVKEKAYLLKPTKGDAFIVGESEVLPLSFSSTPSISWYKENKICRVKYFDIKEKKILGRDFSIKAFETAEKALAAAELFIEEIEKRSDTENYFEIFVSEYFKTDIGNAAAYKIYRKQLDFPHKEFDIDPYVIGLWLADGTHHGPQITSADQEIINYLDEYFSKFGLVRNSKGEKGITHDYTTGTYKGGPGKNAFLNFLKDKNLIKNKHIPMEMLLTSRKNRLRLLAGILDGDGYLCDGNCYEFVQKREELFDQVIFLSRSLGFSCYKAPCVKTCTNAPNGPKDGNYFRCCISGHGIEEIPCVLSRKQASERIKERRVYVNSFTLEDIGKREVYRIVTDKEKYLMGDLTVRHRYEPSENNETKKVIISKKPQLYYLPYGYKNVENRITINKEEVTIIKIIFENRYDGMSMKAIADYLNENNYVPRKASQFTHQTVRTVLDNKFYYVGKKKDAYGNFYPRIVEDRYVRPDENLTVHYGYMKNDEGEIQINKKEAEVIIFIFKERKNNKIFKDIASELNSNSNYAKPRKSAAWTQANIPSAVMKNKECYLGNVEGYPAILN